MMTVLMGLETKETPDRIAEQLRNNRSLLQKIVQRLTEFDPAFVMMIGRGSSDHAALYGKYLFETQLGLPTVSAAPSVCTLYKSSLKLKCSLTIGISQSGQSPDICAMMKHAREQGAFTIAIVNDVDSPLAQLAEYVLPILVGQEKAVAATKSYMGSLTNCLHLIACWKQDRVLLEALDQLPDRLTQALKADWTAFIDVFKMINRAFVIGRGYGFPIAQEAALKFKETSKIQAEAFSSAEVLHGPFALMQEDYPALLFTQNDAALSSVIEVSKKMTALNGETCLILARNLIDRYASEKVAKHILPLPDSLHPLCDGVIAIEAFYRALVDLAVKRGFNPDQPNHLTKVTETL